MGNCAYTTKCRECGETHCAMVKCSERKALGPSDATDCSALVNALSDVLTPHAMACVSGLNLHSNPWSFNATDEGRPLITRESCKCSSDSVMYLRALLPEGHPKGFSQNAEVSRGDGSATPTTEKS